MTDRDAVSEAMVEVAAKIFSGFVSPVTPWSKWVKRSKDALRAVTKDALTAALSAREPPAERGMETTAAQRKAAYDLWPLLNGEEHREQCGEGFWMRLMQDHESALDRLSRSPGEWRTMDSAPKDGTPLILVEDGKAWAGRWADSSQEWTGGFQNPTHWMPLPTPPKPGEGR